MTCAKICCAIFIWLYIFLMANSLICGGIAIFTSNWMQRDRDDETITDYAKGAVSNYGLFPYTCSGPAIDVDSQACIDLWQKRDKDGNATIALLMLVGVVLALFAVIWGGIAACPCCCRKFISLPLAANALWVAIVLVIATVMFAKHIEREIENDHLKTNAKPPYTGYKNWTPQVFFSKFSTLACASGGCTIGGIVTGLVAAICECCKRPKKKED